LLTIPFYTEELQGRASFYAGAVLGVHAVCKAIGSPIGGRLSDTYGRRMPVLVSSVILVAASALLTVTITPDTNFLFLTLPLVVIGLGLGMGQGASSAAAIEAAPRNLSGAAAGTYSMMRWVGAVLGIALLGTILDADDESLSLGVFQLVFVILTVASVLACLSALLIHRLAPEEEEPEREPVLVAAVKTETE
jgi:DHA2 family methylenomycin A resistance protein-like MFS transporter